MADEQSVPETCVKSFPFVDGSVQKFEGNSIAPLMHGCMLGMYNEANACNAFAKHLYLCRAMVPKLGYKRTPGGMQTKY